MCRYMRIQGRENAWVTGYPRGIFGICWRMILDGIMSPGDEAAFREIDAWFKAHLPEPEPCKNHEKVITFFKTGTTGEMLQMLAPALRILDRYGYPYDIVYTNAIGTIVYEDDWQAAVRVEDGKMV